MKIILKDINTLMPYDNNPRKNDTAVDRVAKSIETFGFRVPIIIDANDIIVAGHTRLKAAKKLGLKTVPCLVADDLSPEQVKAFRIADNKVGEFAVWDDEKLIAEINELKEMDFDFTTTGFDLIDIEKLTFDKDYDKDNFEFEKIEADSTGIIQYNIIFNDEQEQKTWHDFLLHLKRTMPDYETISERLVAIALDIMSNE
jgi:ParB-like chromosome segregation protein Spo0J